MSAGAVSTSSDHALTAPAPLTEASGSDSISGSAAYAALSPAEANDAIKSSYSKLAKIGEGTYASVFLAQHLPTGRKVAIKKIKVLSSKDGLDVTAIREVKFLKELKHPNVIQMYDVFSSGSTTPSLNLVLEFLSSNLEELIKDRSLIFTPADIKSWMAMTLRGLEYCHRSWCLHRDLKPNNLLISPSGELKIADFGLAREFGDPFAHMTSQVITRWYRPPELLMGSKSYSGAVDIWSVGCIFAELMLRTPYLPGESDLEQLTKICRALGTPTDQDWPDMKHLPDYVQIEKFPKQHMSMLFTAANADTLDLLSRCLTFNPHSRITADEALLHAYFRNAPAPTHYTMLPIKSSLSSATNDKTADHLLLSDSGVNNARRQAAAGSDAVRLRGAANGASAGPGGSKRQLKEDEIMERKRIARKLAFA
ncbi:putative KIN28-cyclin-dependent ser/thr protein kinase [Tilletiaria anomala UBC 951]|uniref:Putative KIN28-cyclin-dependent ser/thr protein kinase n=1 Tax=Tilletiaria anomala (strain ATCC 24038 / CBS 436.72 / UBC 951) TaxID=1037660 RepID=A0A066W5Z2_TILAU|nr:putative KIN28-cyclin-dependent ser/thr protein kinase [Tilletiaria anomala UBC 951]KDN47953.1 putative KIN28-cyclin-dependent ser/thr protein kinase [Tilletiaria anomala UBC 951]